MEIEKLRAILDDLHNRRRRQSELLAEAIPLLKGNVSGDVDAWLAQESVGYGVLEGTRLGPLSSALKEYADSGDIRPAVLETCGWRFWGCGRSF